MRKFKGLYYLGILTLIIVVAIGAKIFTSEDGLTLGSVSATNSYEYTQLTGAVATSSLIRLGQMTLGSVIITEDQAGAVVLWDATSSAAVTDGTYATRVVDFQDASTEGVYTLDVGLNRGLVFVSADGFSFAGDWTITYRGGF